MVDEIYNEFNARKMGIEFKGQVCVMVHCGSRGLGHQVATGWFQNEVEYKDELKMFVSHPHHYA